MRFRLVVDGESHDVDVERRSTGLMVRVDGAEYRARVTGDGKELSVRIGSGRHIVHVQGSSVTVDGVACEVVAAPLDIAESTMSRQTGAGVGSLEVRPPMPGRVVKLPLKVGDVVKRGQAVAVLEAMKMQNEIPSPADGVLREVRVREGETIGADRIIAVIGTS